MAAQRLLQLGFALLAGLLLGWAWFADPGVPWAQRARFAGQRHACTVEGARVEDLRPLLFSPGEDASHKQVRFEMHGDRGRMEIVRWGVPDDSASGSKTVYQLMDDRDRGLVVESCWSAVSCWSGRGWWPPCG